MNNQSGAKPLQWLLWGVLGVALISIGSLFVASRQKKSEPQSALPSYFAVEPFTLTNQLGEAVTLADLLGKVWVADIIFTRCAGPCPRMTEEMNQLQKAFEPKDPVRFVTLTTDPDYDTPAILSAYARKFEADPARWNFLTGPKPMMRAVAAGSLKLGSEEKSEATQQDENDLFIHSTIFALVGKSGKVRGFYESLEPGFREKITRDIQCLMAESR